MTTSPMSESTDDTLSSIATTHRDIGSTSDLPVGRMTTGQSEDQVTVGEVKATVSEVKENKERMIIGGIIGCFQDCRIRCV